MAKRHDKKQEAARRMREQRAREKRQKQMRWGLSIVLAVLVVGGLVATVLVVSKGYDVNQPKANATKTALVFPDEKEAKKAKVDVELYEDFLCPACGQFQVGPDKKSGNGPKIKELVDDSKIKLKFRPMNFLRNQSTTDYSLRASSAATCAADDGKFFEYEQALFVNQPPEGGEGLPDDELISMGKDVGLDKKFEKCVKDKRYYGWVDQLTDAAFDEGIETTPTAKINGKEVESKDFADELDKAIAKAYPEDAKKDKEKKDEDGKKKD